MKSRGSGNAVVKSIDQGSRGGYGDRSPSGVLGHSYRIVSPPALRGKFHRGAWARVVYSLYPVGMVRTWARVAGFQRMNPMVESSAMRSAVGVFGQVPVFVELGGDETAVTGVAGDLTIGLKYHPQ